MNMYPAHGHPEQASGVPWFRIQGDQVYPDRGHPNGSSGIPWYSMR